MLALTEHARWCDDDVREAVRRQHAEWLELCRSSARQLGVPAGAVEPEAVRLTVLMAGLGSAVSLPGPGSTAADARAVLVHRVTALTTEVNDR